MGSASSAACMAKAEGQTPSGLIGALSRPPSLSIAKQARASEACLDLWERFGMQSFSLARNSESVALVMQLCHRQRALLLHGRQRGPPVEAHHLQGACGDPQPCQSWHSLSRKFYWPQAAGGLRMTIRRLTTLCGYDAEVAYASSDMQGLSCSAAVPSRSAWALVCRCRPYGGPS